MNEEWWRMKVDDFKLLRGFADYLTDGWTFVNVESLLRLKILNGACSLGFQGFFDFDPCLRNHTLIFSRESDSTITNVCPFVRSSAKPLNSLKSSSFIIHPSSFIIFHSSIIILHHSSFIISRLLSFSACFSCIWYGILVIYWKYDYPIHPKTNKYQKPRQGPKSHILTLLFLACYTRMLRS